MIGRILFRWFIFVNNLDCHKFKIHSIRDECYIRINIPYFNEKNYIQKVFNRLLSILFFNTYKECYYLVFQAVNYLDLVIDDGRGYAVYLVYSLLNYPKIVSKILPFAFFLVFHM